MAKNGETLRGHARHGRLRLMKPAQESETKMTSIMNDLYTQAMNRMEACIANSDWKGARRALERASAIQAHYDTALRLMLQELIADTGSEGPDA